MDIEFTVFRLVELFVLLGITVRPHGFDVGLSDDARRELGEELRQRAAPQLARDDDLALRVDAVDL